MLKKKKKQKEVSEFKEDDYADIMEAEKEDGDDFVEEEAVDEEEPTTNKKINTWLVQEVPTETQRVIINTKTKKAYDIPSAIVEILNRTEE